MTPFQTDDAPSHLTLSASHPDIPLGIIGSVPEPLFLWEKPKTQIFLPREVTQTYRQATYFEHRSACEVTNEPNKKASH